MPLSACVLMGVHLSEEGGTIRLPKGSVPRQRFRASVLRMGVCSACRDRGDGDIPGVANAEQVANHVHVD